MPISSDCLWLFVLPQQTWVAVTETYELQTLKFVLAGPLQKELADPCSKANRPSAPAIIKNQWFPEQTCPEMRAWGVPKNYYYFFFQTLEEERSQINDLIIYLKELEKKSKLNSKQIEENNKDWSRNKWSRGEKTNRENHQNPILLLCRQTFNGLTKQNREKTQIIKIRHERENITTNLTKTKGL